MSGAGEIQLNSLLDINLRSKQVDTSLPTSVSYPINAWHTGRHTPGVGEHLFLGAGEEQFEGKGAISAMRMPEWQTFHGGREGRLQS